jgi:hypothetical protein
MDGDYLGLMLSRKRLILFFDFDLVRGNVDPPGQARQRSPSGRSMGAGILQRQGYIAKYFSLRFAPFARKTNYTFPRCFTNAPRYSFHC